MKSGLIVHHNSFVVRRGDGKETEFRSVAEAFVGRGDRDSVWIKTDGHGYFGPVVRP